MPSRCPAIAVATTASETGGGSGAESVGAGETGNSGLRQSGQGVQGSAQGNETLYALKVVHGNHDLSTRRQIVREMDILRKTDSPYVVKCHGVYDRGGEIQFVLEYMDGGSLEKCVGMPEPFLAAVARQVLHGLEYLRSSALRSRSVGQGSK